VRDSGVDKPKVGAYTESSERDPARWLADLLKSGSRLQRSGDADSEQIFFPLRNPGFATPSQSAQPFPGLGDASLKENPKESFGKGLTVEADG
jgi:hypothetical protein